MGVVKHEDIAAVYVDSTNRDKELVCIDCLTENAEYTQQDIVTHADIERNDDADYFCDRCNKKIE
jgi:hypothetical protein